MNDSWNSICHNVPAELFPEPLPRQLATSIPAIDRPIHGIAFSLEGVLYDDSAWRRWLLLLAARMGLQTRYASFFRIWDCDFSDTSGRIDNHFWLSIEEFLRSAGMSQGQIDEIEAASRGRLRQLRDEVRPFPCIRQMISRLTAAGIEPCVLAPPRYSHAELRLRLRQLGIDDRFQQLMVLPETARACSRGDVVRHLANRMARPGNTAFVGRHTDELAAASEVGMLTIAFNHDADARADWCIEHFEQLAELLKFRSKLRAAG